MWSGLLSIRSLSVKGSKGLGNGKNDLRYVNHGFLECSSQMGDDDNINISFYLPHLSRMFFIITFGLDTYGTSLPQDSVFEDKSLGTLSTFVDTVAGVNLYKA